MSITLDLLPSVENLLQEQAYSRGLTLEAYLQEWLTESFNPRQESSTQTLERTLVEIADLVPANAPVLTADRLSRESIYSREDEC